MELQISSTAGRETTKFAYQTITLGGHKGPIMLECVGLKVAMSLQRYFEPTNSDEDIERRKEIGEVALGLRRDLEVISDAVRGVAQSYKAGIAIEPIKVLARREPNDKWSSTGWVVDGAIRVQAALESGIPEIPAWLVAPHFEDTPLEGMFLHYNFGHGARLTLRERDYILRTLARRYMRDHTGEARDARVFGKWLTERTGLPANLVAQVTRNEFQVRTPEKYAEATQLLRNGLSPAEISKRDGMPSRAAIEKQARKLGIPYQQKARTTAGGDGKPGEVHPAARAHHNGDAPDATPEGILESRIQRIDPQATARDLAAPLKAAQDDLTKAFAQITDWVLQEAAEYQIEQAKVVWKVVEQHLHWHETLKLNVACRIYRDQDLAERDLPLLKQAVAEAERALRLSRRRDRAKARRAKRAG
jgi:hypothetical protein